MPHISLRPEKIFELYGFPITNSLLLTWILLIALAIFAYFFQKGLKEGKTFSIVFYVNLILKPVYGILESLMKERIAFFFPLLASFFFFILFSNWFGLIPGVGSFLIKEQVPKQIVKTETSQNMSEEHAEKVPLLRAPTADLNTTFALAIVSVFFIQYFGFKHLGLKYGQKFINLKSPIGFGLGILDILSEFSRVLSFSFRLFGNVFAGEVLLVIVASLVPILASFPFLMLELFVGLIQALVFTMLTAVFFSTALEHTEH